MYERILISTDGSEIAKKGVEHGLALAKSLNAPVVILNVTEPLPVYPYAVGLGGYAMSSSLLADYDKEQKAAGEAILSEAKQAAERLGVAVETLHVADAPPAEAIIATAKSRNCGLIVMASHGRRGLGRLVLGSVAAEVLASTPAPVLVVR